MNTRRSFIRTLVAAVALSPLLAWTRRKIKGEWMRAENPARIVWLKNNFGVMEVYSLRSCYTWDIPAGEAWPFSTHEPLRVRGHDYEVLTEDPKPLPKYPFPYELIPPA